MRSKTPAIKLKMDDLGRELLKTLAADLFDTQKNYVKQISEDLRLLDLPDDMMNYKLFFSILYEIDFIAPSPKFIASQMEIRGIEKADEWVQDVLKYRARTSEIPGMAIMQSARNFYDWYRRSMKIARLEAALEITKHPFTMTPSEEAAAITSLLTQVAPLTVRAERLSLVEREELWIEQRDQYEEEAKKTGVLHPTFPIQKLNEAVPGLRPSNPAMFGAQSKFGKTILGDVFGEWWAWEEGFAVCVIGLETEFGDYHERFLARHQGIPMRFLSQRQIVRLSEHRSITVGPISHRDPRWSPYIGEGATQAIIDRRNKAGGILYHSRLRGGPTAEQVVSEISMFMEEIAKPAGKRTVVIVDYLQKIGRPKNTDQRVGFADNAATLKNGIDSLGCYALILSQEEIADPTGGVERAQKRQIGSFGSKEPMMYFQTYISLQRPNAEFDEAVMIKKGTPTFNAMGEQRFYSREGSPSGTYSKFVVVTSNYGQAGAVVPVLFEGELFNLYDPEKAFKQGDWAIPMYKQLIDENYGQLEHQPYLNTPPYHQENFMPKSAKPYLTKE